jgi:hypothetical protein
MHPAISAYEFMFGKKQDCQIFLKETYLYYTQNIPNSHKIYQMVAKYAKWP